MKNELLELPVTAHIKKFCDSFFGNPVVLDDSSSHVIALKVFLDLPAQIELFHEDKETRVLPNFVYLKNQRMRYMRILLRKSNAQQMLKYLDKVFEEELHLYVTNHSIKKSHTEGEKHSIEAFCENHNIEIDVDISWDALQKLYYRYKKLPNKIYRPSQRSKVVAVA